MAFAPSEAIWTHADPFHLWTTYPVSVVALSVQERLIWVEETAVATRLLGAAGGESGVVTLATFE